jgi:hypothetical protein
MSVSRRCSELFRGYYCPPVITYNPDQASSTSSSTTTQKKSFRFTGRRIPPKGVMLEVRWFQSNQYSSKTTHAILLDSLAIIVPSIPEGGTKSRVETQVRVTVDLAHASATGADFPSQYDRVGSWKWLRLPKGTAMKKRTRKEGKIGLSLFPRP